MQKQLNGSTVNVNEEGYLTNLAEWNESVAEAIAQEEGIPLTPRHWEILHFLQDQQRKEVALTIRRIGQSGVISIKEFYELFPGGPLKKASKIAGIPKPVGCI
jgi:tRNA 2-thiouridine synthesizing protein E